MIKASELRLGNWVNNGDKYFTVDANVIYDAATLEYYELFGIPLTPDILIKCGFEKHQKSATIVHFIEEHDRVEYSPIIIKLINGFDNGDDKWFYDNGRFSFKYLHQLQNLYFALTGEELNVSL